MTKAKTIEETYKKLSQREHVLHRPNMYIGEIKRSLEEMWIMDNDSKMSKRMVEYSPGFLKIFDEVLTNALDHSTRDVSVSMIKVEYSKETGEISVWNNGSGVPVVVHKEHNMYVPELIFGNLLAGSNYDDSQQRIGAGVNGLGVKLCNIFSKRFVIETLDSNAGLKFIQEYSQNMTQKGKPKVTKNSGKSYTKITFLPDYSRFGMKGLEDDTAVLINKRVYDCIACTDKSVSVFLNGEKLRGKGLLDYSNYFFEQERVKSYYDSFSQRVGKNEMIWEYIIVPSDHFEQVSFVNGNSTYAGGKHVDHVIYQITSKLKTLLETKKKLKDVKPAIIKEKIFLFLRATIVNPQFSSQTKEQLTTQVKDFGCKVEISEKFIEKLWKSPIVEDIVEFCKMKETMDLAKSTDGKKKNKIYVPKLEDALWAGTAKSEQCTLILTEGLSAMTFALWGRSIVGPERFGVFPLKGKCCSEDTSIPLWNGEIKLAKDIQKGDLLIGDDGNKRTVLTLYKGNGKMYEISQDRGDSYKVNDEHILTLCMPEHKKIFWLPSNYTWRSLYWDKQAKNIKAKEMKANIKIRCKECNIMITAKCIKKHYTRKHKDVKYTPYKLQDKDMNDPEVIRTRKCLEEFLSTIDDNNIIDICIQDYLNVTESFKRKLKGIRGECVNWDSQDVLLDPYVLGVWLGDGMKSGYAYSCDGKNDPEIMDYLTKWGENNDAKFINNRRYNYNISSIDNYKFPGCAPLKKLLSQYNLINNKHIPKEYLINSKDIRLRLLAGIIDTDGYVHKDGTIEICQSIKHKTLVDDIVYLSRSLGFYTYVSDKVTNYNYKESGEKAEAFRVKISGFTEEIPTLLPRKRCKSTNQYNLRNSTGTIQIKEIPNENYVGIGIDGNSRFLINDFTVTHNCLNIRDATVSQLMNNEEINNLKQIVGLKQGVEYKDTKNLRYGKIMCLTDADCDGSHIKGLLVNLFHCWWPSLLKLDFIQTLRTPIVKAICGSKVIEFYTEQDYKSWQSTTNTRGYQIRYFKGLGTSKKEDAQETFKRIDRLRVDYYYKDEKCDDAILLAFEKDKNIKTQDKTIEDTESNENVELVKCSDRRKRWLSNYDKNSYIDVKENKVSYQDLIHKELVHFSIYDNLRSIPSLCDGLKPSQRKILYYMLKNNIKKSIKVAQLSGYVSAETGYHHGEASLQGAIVSMAQNFVGTNNINLLYPDGNHGCLHPDTEIMMWNGCKKFAKDIKIGDELVGDDGYKRTVLKTTSGQDDMYEINIDGEVFIVNSQHKLTLKYSGHLNIFWRESDMSWRVTYFDPFKMKGVSKHISTNLSSDKKETYNKSSLTKEQAYNEMVEFVQTLNIDKSGIFDIKVCDYLKLNNTDKHHFKSLKNNKCIQWNNNKNLPIDPYIFGSWLGDGNSDGSGITSIDTEIIKKWVIEMDKIGCEIVHDKVKENHDNYHYSIRTSGNGTRDCVGSGLTCEGCTYKKSEICSWTSDIKKPILKKLKSQTSGKNNWKKLLIKHDLFNNKNIPFDYIYTSKENRLQLLAGFIDTDGYVKYQNKVPQILIGQSKRLRQNLIYELKFLCETLGYNCKIYHEQKNRQTKEKLDASLIVLSITGDNLQEIPCLLTRKKIQPYVSKRNAYASSFTVKSLGIGKYCGWEIDGNNRFLLGNFIITHNSRLLGGKDAASPRYIFTKLSDITPSIFDTKDSPLLTYLNDDGIQIEPEWFIPVLPMVLINGCEGIGTGYSTYIPPYNPKDIISNIIRIMEGKNPLQMTPYFKNFHGDLKEIEQGSYTTFGRWEKLSDTQIKIIELPVGTWVTTYKEFLESMIEGNTTASKANSSKTTQKKTTKRQLQLKDVKNKTRDENDDICFIVEFCRASDLDDLIKNGTLEKTLKLTRSFTTNNMYLFSDNLILTKYKDTNDILLDFYDIRLEYYESRRQYLIKTLKNDLLVLNSKIRFINEYISGTLDINRKNKDYIVSLLEERDYPKLKVETKTLNEENQKSYDYLVRMPIISLSEEKISELENHRDIKQSELDTLQSKTDKDLWKDDLNNILKML